MGTKIAKFVNDLRNTVQELYGIANEDAINSIAINHVLANLEDSLRKKTKVLQLAGNIKLENILELLQEKLEGNVWAVSSTSAPLFECAAVSACPAPNRSAEDSSRLSRLETMMTNVLDKLDRLHNAPPMGSSSVRKICENCHQAGHDMSHC